MGPRVGDGVSDAVVGPGDGRMVGAGDAGAMASEEATPDTMGEGVGLVVGLEVGSATSEAVGEIVG